MNIHYLIDIGSSTVKVYKRENGAVSLVEQKTFDFKNGFTKNGLSADNKERLFLYFEILIHKYSLTNRNTKLYATGIFRDIICQKTVVEDFFHKTGLYFNIISHDLEAFYLEKAWINRNCKNIKKMLVINIGGKTTEILLCENGIVVDRTQKLSIGVGTILKQYPQINDNYSKYDLNVIVEEIYKTIKQQLSNNDSIYDIAIYTGGELNYMTCANYPLMNNTVCNDISHPYMIKAKDYYKKNEEIFSKLSLLELKSMMPNNPEWMGGARACSALAQAIFQYYKVNTIIPSDSNLIDGVNIQEAKNVVICGSFNKHLKQIERLICKLNTKEITVLSPKDTAVIGKIDNFILFKNDIVENHNTWPVEELHLRAIDKCDFVIACNFDNYIGVSTTFELEHAYRRGKKVVFIEDNEIADIFGKRIDVYPMPCEVGVL